MGSAIEDEWELYDWSHERVKEDFGKCSVKGLIVEEGLRTLGLTWKMESSGVEEGLKLFGSQMGLLHA